MTFLLFHTAQTGGAFFLPGKGSSGPSRTLHRDPCGMSVNQRYGTGCGGSRPDQEKIDYSVAAVRIVPIVFGLDLCLSLGMVFVWMAMGMTVTAWAVIEPAWSSPGT